jgi:hypothetical protein
MESTHAYRPYCPTRTRKDLEERVWSLVARLSILTSRLTALTGKDRHAFISAKADCQEAQFDIIRSRQQLQAHRLNHGC